jgi:hypothetical protein
MGLESTITPDKVPGPTHSFNDATWQSWIDKGLEEGIPHSVQAPHDRLIRFVTGAGDNPIKHKVHVLKRIKHEGKEYLVALKSLHSMNWIGEEIQLYDYVEGFHIEQTLKPKIDDKKEIIGYERGKEKPVYSIEFSKTAVDKMIGKQDKSEIQYYIKHPSGTQKDYFTYEQFVNNTWDQNMSLLLSDGSPQYATSHPIA